MKCVTKIHILRFICNHCKYYCIGSSPCGISYQHSYFGKHARSSDNDLRFASTFDTEIFSQVLIAKVSVKSWLFRI